MVLLWKEKQGMNEAAEKQWAKDESLGYSYFGVYMGKGWNFGVPSILMCNSKKGDVQ